MLKDSELIINQDGSVYHLHLKPGEIAKTIFTVGDPDRVAEVSKHFDSIELTRSHRELVTHTGMLGKKRVSVISTGMGTDNVDIVLNELDALVNIDFETRKIKDDITSLNIIRLGTSGALQKNVALDSVLVSEYAIGLDTTMFFYPNDYMEDEYIDGLQNAIDEYLEEHETFITTYTAAASPKLLKRFDEYQKGITVTSPGFYAPQGRHLRINPWFGNFVKTLASFKHDDRCLSNFEMETSGIYALGSLLGHNCISFNAILVNRIDNTFSKNPNAAIQKMIQDVLEKVEKL
jgi:uridine phosphorylase